MKCCRAFSSLKGCALAQCRFVKFGLLPRTTPPPSGPHPGVQAAQGSPPRCGAMSCGRFRPPQGLDGGLVITKRILGLPQHPVIPTRRMRIQPERLAYLFDALGRSAFHHRSVGQHCPPVGVIRVPFQRRRERCVRFRPPSFVRQHDAESPVVARVVPGSPPPLLIRHHLD